MTWEIKCDDPTCRGWHIDIELCFSRCDACARFPSDELAGIFAALADGDELKQRVREIDRVIQLSIAAENAYLKRFGVQAAAICTSARIEMWPLDKGAPLWSAKVVDNEIVFEPIS